MLLSWAAKQGWKPTFVDLDIGQGSITIPGCIAGTPIEVPIDPVEGIPLEMPLVFFQGHTTPRSLQLCLSTHGQSYILMLFTLTPSHLVFIK